MALRGVFAGHWGTVGVSLQADNKCLHFSAHFFATPAAVWWNSRNFR